MNDDAITNQPVLIVLAGPNGSGKSTLTTAVRSLFALPFIDPDEVARNLRPDDPAAAMIEAGRLVLERVHDLLRRRQSFAIETTLSGHTQLRLMSEAHDDGYLVTLLFVCDEASDVNIVRVKQRVGEGGHDVPVKDIRRRYQRSLAHLPRAMQVADLVALYDTSWLEGHRRALVMEHGHVTFQDVSLPQWVTMSIGALLTPPSPPDTSPSH